MKSLAISFASLSGPMNSIFSKILRGLNGLSCCHLPNDLRLSQRLVSFSSNHFQFNENLGVS
jgi:hypothetical protein